MKWVEGITQPRVWTSKGPLEVNEMIELSDEEAGYLIERGQVIDSTEPVESAEPSEDAPRKPRGRPKGSKNKPKVEAEDADAEGEEDE